MRHSLSSLAVALVSALLLSACQSGGSNSQAEITGSTSKPGPARAPADVLTSRAETMALVADKPFEAYDRDLEVIILTTYGANNRLTQSPFGREEVTTAKIRFENDGRICNLDSQDCFFVRKSFAGFDAVDANGATIKSLSAATL